MISVVVCSKEQGKLNQARQHFSTVLDDHEFVAIHDPKSLAAGFSEGLARSKGDIVAFAHDDVEFLGAEVGSRIRRHLETVDVVGIAGTDLLVGPSWIAAGPPHIFGQVSHLIPNGYDVCLYGAHQALMTEMVAMDGLFLAFRRSVIESIGWDEETFDGFHLYDVDATFRSHLAGFRLGVAGDLPILHRSGGEYGDTWRTYADHFMKKHSGRIVKRTPYPFRFGSVAVRTKQEALEAMTPAYLRPG